MALRRFWSVKAVVVAAAVAAAVACAVEPGGRPVLIPADEAEDAEENECTLAGAGSGKKEEEEKKEFRGPAPAPAARNPALKMLGLPSLPRKLPSRNWLIFWAVTGAFTTAIVYDKREKKRATAKWRRVVEPLAREPVGAANQLPRKLTIYLEAPPGDGLRAAQDHFIEYVKPVLSASGLDWDFVQGRQQGDVRAAVAERIRRSRAAREQPGRELAKTEEDLVADVRRRMGVPEYEGVAGDIVIGRHTWKEYVRGLHEGWLGPLDPPPEPETPTAVEAKAGEEASTTAGDAAAAASADGDDHKEGEKKKTEEGEEEKKKDEKASRPPQPRPHNAPSDYASASLPNHAPAELAPSTAVPFPHRLGFTQTMVRLGRFLNRRKLADQIGREVAAVCLAASREWRDAEQQRALEHEERDWPKSVWKDDDDDGEGGAKKERIWASPMVLDARVAERMRRFEASADLDAAAAAVVVPEDEVEGWIKGSARGLWRWGARALQRKPRGPDVGSLDDE
ncbi:hypothetical protein CDD83_1253 [Cordyceps sp. RAO-2017]|nr:hypothetical protein CDD83_1253 [Cordyceps sp. RAO-2017]